MKLSTKIALLANRIKASDEAWEKYKKEHPNTQKSKKDFEDEKPDKSEKLEKPNKDDKPEKPEDPDEENDVTEHLEDDDPPKKEDVQQHDLDPNIDPAELNKTLDDILGEKEHKDIGEKLESLAEKIVEVSNFDQYVQGLPEKAKSLAEHLRGVHRKNEESAQKIIEERPNIQYEDYVKEMNKRKDPILSESNWKAIAKKLQEKADKEKKREDSKGR